MRARSRRELPTQPCSCLIDSIIVPRPSRTRLRTGTGCSCQTYSIRTSAFAAGGCVNEPRVFPTLSCRCTPAAGVPVTESISKRAGETFTPLRRRRRGLPGPVSQVSGGAVTSDRNIVFGTVGCLMNGRETCSCGRTSWDDRPTRPRCHPSV